MTERQQEVVSALAARSRDVLSLVALLGVLTGFLWLVTDNTRFRAKFAEMAGVEELRQNQQELKTSQEEIKETQNEILNSISMMRSRYLEIDRARSAEMTKFELTRDGILDRLIALESNKADKTPSIRFLSSGNSITDGRIGGLVTITYSFLKLRDCGRPSPDDFFMDSNGSVFRFEEVSILDEDGKGVPSEPDPLEPQALKYTARIPADRGVVPGVAQGWVIIRAYEDCPWLSPVESPKVVFNITK